MKTYHSLILLTLINFFISCNNEKYTFEYYDSGRIKSKTQINDEGIPNGIHEEYYETLELKLKTTYNNGQLDDSLYCYYKNGDLKEKGLMKGGYMVSWWKVYDTLGKYKGLEEHVILEDGTSYVNQFKYFKDDQIDYEKSHFFEVIIPDTLNLGKNIGELKHHSKYTAQKKYLKVIIENQYSENTFKNDTFAEKPDYSRFGIYAPKVGTMKIKGEINEVLVDTKMINIDSATLNIQTRKQYFAREVFVSDN